LLRRIQAAGLETYEGILGKIESNLQGILGTIESWFSIVLEGTENRLQKRNNTILPACYMALATTLGSVDNLVVCCLHSFHRVVDAWQCFVHSAH
jgi:hypothetical protein